MKAFIFFTLLCITLVSAEIFFSEEFGDGWEKRWVVSQHKQKEGTAGEFGISAGKFYNDAEEDKGLQTQTDARFYQISAEMKEFSNKGKNLFVQFTVKHQQNIDCGGGYVKLMPAGLNQDEFNGDSNYNIMFGPDICGMTKRIHAIFTYKGKNHLIKNEVPCKWDDATHIYAFHIFPNNSFSILVDGVSEKSGSLPENWDFLPAKMILDPSVSKPADWVDQKEMDDPTDVKPEGHDDVPKQIRDPEASMPEDWDAELDGDWEAPLIDNPAFKGEWKAKKIPNPEYKGEWVHPKIDNPEYKEDDEIYAYESNKYIGIEIWQVKSGTIFDKFLVTDDFETAQEWTNKALKSIEGEKEMREKEDARIRDENVKAQEKGDDKKDEKEEDVELKADTNSEDVHDEL